jgi:hypothetical protein
VDWAASSLVQVVVGDFSGDSIPDIALTGQPGWNTLPVAYSQNGGNFKVVNNPVGSFGAEAATRGAMALSADFLLFVAE